MPALFDAARRQNYTPIWLSAACVLRPDPAGQGQHHRPPYEGASFAARQRNTRGQRVARGVSPVRPDLPYPDSFSFTWVVGFDLFEAASRPAAAVTSRRSWPAAQAEERNAGRADPAAVVPTCPHREGLVRRIDRFDGPGRRRQQGLPLLRRIGLTVAAALLLLLAPRRRRGRRPTTRTRATTSSAVGAGRRITTRFVVGKFLAVEESSPCHRSRPRPASSSGARRLAVLPDPGDLVLGCPSPSRLAGIAGLHYPRRLPADYPITPEDDVPRTRRRPRPRPPPHRGAAHRAFGAGLHRQLRRHGWRRALDVGAIKSDSIARRVDPLTYGRRPRVR